MRLALLTTDSREHFKDYSNPEPYFGTAPEALLEGFKFLPSDIEVHVVCCLQDTPTSSPDRLAPNIHYHPLAVPKNGWLRSGYQGCIRAVRRRLREISPDIVHGQGTERDCAVSAVLSGFPNVLTIHGNMRLIAEFFRARPLSFYWLAARLEKFFLRRTAGVVAISTYTQANGNKYAGQFQEDKMHGQGTYTWADGDKCAPTTSPSSTATTSTCSLMLTTCSTTGSNCTKSYG
jgi:hypothetical protein